MRPDSYESLLWPLRQRLRMDCCCIVERMNTVEEISPLWPSYGGNYSTGISNLIWVLIMVLANTLISTIFLMLLFSSCRFHPSFVLYLFCIIDVLCIWNNCTSYFKKVRLYFEKTLLTIAIHSHIVCLLFYHYLLILNHDCSYLILVLRSLL